MGIAVHGARSEVALLLTEQVGRIGIECYLHDIRFFLTLLGSTTGRQEQGGTKDIEKGSDHTVMIVVIFVFEG